jgi:hypothetical protein
MRIRTRQANSQWVHIEARWLSVAPATPAPQIMTKEMVPEGPGEHAIECTVTVMPEKHIELWNRIFFGIKPSKMDGE